VPNAPALENTLEHDEIYRAAGNFGDDDEENAPIYWQVPKYRLYGVRI
jgi:hypothetical protein